MTVETELWDPTERFDTVEAQQAYLADALEVGDPTLIVAVIGDIARAAGARLPEAPGSAGKACTSPSGLAATRPSRRCPRSWKRSATE
ncbi:MAG: hypothetical protein OXH76_21230 [Boseongicola sp.]|nr:hypothetical protein [Boseongicola sp.]